MTLEEHVRRLNRLLSGNVRFFLESGAACRQAPCSDGVDAPAPPDQVAVMVVERPGGVFTSARCPLRQPCGTRRRALLSLASSMAECAMLLGLGTGVYKEGGRGALRHAWRA
jgi:hypothetical protein